MNFLAHFHLSGDDPQVTIGNFIGDFVKGSNLDDFSVSVQHGIRLHRSIDDFTDSHEITRRSRKRLVETYRHYSGVIVDIFYDHFLAVHWSRFSGVSLEEFTKRCYQLVDEHLSVLPRPAQYVFPHMKSNNWLYNYQYVEGISRTLSGMSRRTRFRSGMENAVTDLKKDYESFEDDFLEFFPKLQLHSENTLKRLENGKL